MYKFCAIVLLLSGAFLASSVYADELHYEADYVKKFCVADAGETGATYTQEFRIADGGTTTRVDCQIDRPEAEGNSYSIEFDFSSKWAESYSQAMYYAFHTGSEPAVGFIHKKGTSDRVYRIHYHRLQQLITFIGKPVLVICVDTAGEVVGCPK